MATMLLKAFFGVQTLFMSTLLTILIICRAQEALDASEGPVSFDSYPTYNYVPHTNFACGGKSWGFYADPEAQCQVFHLCQGVIRASFLCGNGTLFSQSRFICDHWYNVQCKNST